MAEKAVAAATTEEQTFFTASEAAKQRGVTYTSVLNSKDKLAAVGVDTSGKGKDWKIPAAALDVLPLPRAASTRISPENGGRDILSMQEEYTAIEEIISEKKAELADLTSRSKALKKDLENAKRTALKDAEQELAAAQARMAAISELVGSDS
jgi:hypothetical protein